MHVMTPIEDSYVLLIKKGVYLESKLFFRGNHVFTSVKDGFAKLHTSKITSVAGLHWEEAHTNQGEIRVVGCEVHFIPHAQQDPRTRRAKTPTPVSAAVAAK